jgi:hypothetical protein
LQRHGTNHEGGDTVSSQRRVALGVWLCAAVGLIFVVRPATAETFTPDKPMLTDKPLKEAGAAVEAGKASEASAPREAGATADGAKKGDAGTVKTEDGGCSCVVGERAALAEGALFLLALILLPVALRKPRQR